MNPLDDYPQIRKALYLVQWVVNLGLGATAVVVLAQGDSPQWLVITQAVFNFVWSYTGITAQGNVPSYEDVVEGNAPPPEAGHVNWPAIAAIATVVLVVIVLFGWQAEL